MHLTPFLSFSVKLYTIPLTIPKKDDFKRAEVIYEYWVTISKYQIQLVFNIDHLTGKKVWPNYGIMVTFKDLQGIFEACLYNKCNLYPTLLCNGSSHSWSNHYYSHSLATMGKKWQNMQYNIFWNSKGWLHHVIWNIALLK